MKLTQEQVSAIMYEGGYYDENEVEIFETVEETIVDSDMEKNSFTKRIVIKELGSGKFYAAHVGESPWWKQAEVNAEAEWREVKQKTKTIKYYE